MIFLAPDIHLRCGSPCGRHEGVRGEEAAGEGEEQGAAWKAALQHLEAILKQS